MGVHRREQQVWGCRGGSGGAMAGLGVPGARSVEFSGQSPRSRPEQRQLRVCPAGTSRAIPAAGRGERRSESISLLLVRLKWSGIVSGEAPGAVWHLPRGDAESRQPGPSSSSGSSSAGSRAGGSARGERGCAAWRRFDIAAQTEGDKLSSAGAGEQPHNIQLPRGASWDSGCERFPACS